MSDLRMPKDPNIKRRIDRTEEMIDRLDADEVSLNEGTEFYDEGKIFLDDIRPRLDKTKGTVLEIE
jgi:exodeoxyribonuclease VII small subunit